MDQLAEICGWVGAVSVLAGYALFSLGWIPNGYLFQMANWVGSTALGFHAYHIESWPSVTINICWSIISAVAMLRLYLRRRSAETEDSADSKDVAGEPSAERLTR
ncbi:hypothetical protein GCM10023081_35840 [Arthrobacter ginkgonis]|uniref:CBU-0592-like domain-containing protein n=1 Tax=Arthrobacter ginkgonis TaxID=1630594 RepID=A0ABP7CXL7_9MICC